MAQGDMFLELTNNIKGESEDDKFKDTIQVLSYSLGNSNAGTGGYGGGSGAGKAAFSDLSVTKYVDKSSPVLFQTCATGTHIDKATLHIRKSGDKPQEYLTIELTEAYVSSFSQSGADGAGLPSESMTLNFSKITMTYKEQKKDGSLGAGSPIGWDLKANKKV